MGERRSRRELVTAALASVVLAGCGGSDDPPRREPDGGPTAQADLSILSFLLPLEHLTADFYERLADEGPLESADRSVISGLQEDEAQHGGELERLLVKLGGEVPARPLPDYDRLLAGRAAVVLARAAELEDLVAAAYLGQIARVQDDEVLAALLSIHSVEGRHSAGLNHRIGRSFAPDGALAVPLGSDAVRQRLVSFTA